MDVLFRALVASTPQGAALRWGRVEAEACPALSRHCHVTAVPTVVLLSASNRVVESFAGDDNDVAAPLTQAVQKFLSQPGDDNDNDEDWAAVGEATTHPSTAPSPEAVLHRRLEQLIKSSDVMVFLKGTPDAPRCGFSRQIVELLTNSDIAFGSFDILQDEQVRQGLKTFSDWPTYPQLYVNGTLVGGLDIVKELANDGPLREQLGLNEGTTSAAAADADATTTAQQQSSSLSSSSSSLHDRLKALVNQEPIMVFLKGLPSAPQCGFSRQLVEILDDSGVPYGSFNILQDDEVRQGLKTYSNWPTYPQLYVNGTLVGGLDIVKELQDDGSLHDVLRGK